MTLYILQNFEMFSGDDFKINVTVRDKDGVVVNLTGVIAVVWALSKAPGKTALVTKGLGTGVVVTDAVNGVLQVTIDTVDTEDYSGQFYHEIQILDSLGKKATVLRGYATLIKDQIQ